MDDLISFSSQPCDTALSIIMGDCRNVLKEHIKLGISYDAIITDPPYEVGLHGKSWDKTGISFSAELWTLFQVILKPGGYVAAFAASRLYHRMAVAAEDAGFELHPFLVWKFEGGLCKPAPSVSELFDRDNLDTREVIGYRRGSGFTKANVDQGAQQRTHTAFPIYASHVSPEAQAWRGWHYGVNCMRPMFEPIMLARKPLDQAHMIDNLRVHRTGALNLSALAAQQGNGWPTTVLEHAKARKAEHGSDHPSVKPVALLEDLCLLMCPPGGHILDPFAGTGTTGVAARKCGFACSLIEQNPSMEAVMHQRLGSLLAAGSPFG